MEAKRILQNRKSIILFLVFLTVNMGLFYYSFLRNYEPLPREEIQEIDYGKKYEAVERQMNRIKGISIFQNRDSAMADEKMLEDYSKLKTIRGETHQAEGISLWYASSIQNYLVLFFCVWLIFLTFETERRGLFPLVYSTAGGRGRLALRHLICYFLVTLGSSAVFHGSLLIMACIKTENWSALSQPVQFVTPLANCVLPANGLSFFLILTAASACGIFVTALLIWMVLLMIHNSKIALTVCGVLFASEYFLNQWIPAQSQWGMLKHINIMTLLNLNHLYAEYHLHTIGSLCLERHQWVYVAMLTFAVLFSAICLILASKRRPYYKEHFLERTIHRFLCSVRAALCKLPGWGLEWHKILISQKGLIILTFFFMVLMRGVWQPVSEGEQLTLGSTGEYMRDYYAQWGGPVTDKVLADVEDRRKQLEQLVEDGSPATAYYSNGLKTAQKRLAYIDRHREMNLWLVDPAGYKSLFGTKGEDSTAASHILVLFCLAALISGIFSYDKKSSMEPLLRSAPNGRSKLQKRKYCIIGILVVFLWAVASGMEFYNILQVFPLENFNAPLQSLPFMRGVPMKITIWQYCVLTYAIRLVWMLMAALLYSEVAIAIKNQEISVLLCALSLIPSVLYLMGMKSLSYFAVTKIIHTSHFFRQGYPGIWKEAIVFVLGTATLTICFLRRRRAYVKN